MMRLSYEKIRYKDAFRRLVGMDVSHFEELVRRVHPRWELRLEERVLPGRPHRLEGLENHLLVLLMYYRCYITMEFLGFLFGVDQATICRTIKRLEPMVAGAVPLKKDRTLIRTDVETILIDCTEQPIERPTRGQRKYYSGKKKRHTLKTELRICEQGEILDVDTAHEGKRHDMAIRKDGDPIPKQQRAYVDSGYQGLHKTHAATEWPEKRKKGKTLDREARQYNTALARVRICVEHKIRQMKTFRIFSERYRNKRRAYGVKVNIIAGITNLKCGFA